MPRVPYNPVPQEVSRPTPTPMSGIDVPAIGMESARAAQGLGKEIEHSSDQIFARAQALQQLNSEAEAKAADAKYMIEAGQLHANYSSLAGKAAVDAYPKYQQDLEDKRQEIRSGLSSDYARKLYDGPSLSTAGRTIFNGAGHAATENKKYALGASNARVQAWGDQALARPFDYDGFESSINGTREEVAQQGALNGWSPEQTEQATAVAVSSQYVKRIEGMAKESPFKAKDLMDDAIADGNIRGEDVGKITNHVRQAMYTVGARNISHDIATGADLPGRWEVPISQAKQAIGQFESGGNYKALGVEVFDKNGRSRGRALGKYQVMPENLSNFLEIAGLPNMSSQEFLNNPGAQDAVFEKVFGGYMKQYGNFNDAASMWFSGRPAAKAGDATDANKTTVPMYIQATNAILAKNMSLGDKEARGREIAQKMSPDDPLFEDYVVQRVNADHNLQQSVKRQDAYANREVIEGALMGGPNGKVPTTIEEIKADPKAEAAWNALDDTTRRKYMQVLARNAKGDTAWDDAKLRRYQQLKGMAATDPAEFMGVDAVGENLPISARRELITMQGKLKANAEGDPRVQKAMQVLGPDLQSAGISRQQNKEDYYHFVGALQDALSQWQEDNKKAPKASEVREIGMRLLQEQSTSWWGNPWSKTPMFRVPVPAEEAEKIKADPAWKSIGVAPTDDQIQRVYTRKLYQDLYGGTAKKPQAGPQIRPPMSGVP